MHNRTKINEGSSDQPYWLNDASPPQDKQVNQYTSTPVDVLKYDVAGNLAELTLGCIGDIQPIASGGDRLINSSDLSYLLSKFSTTDTYADLNRDGVVNTADMSILLSRFGRSCDYEVPAWDYQHRLVSYVGTTTGSGASGAAAGTKTHAYKYDPLGRRIAKTVDTAAEFQRVERFVWGGQSVWQMLAREVTPGTPEGAAGITGVTTFVYQPSGGYIDDVVAVRRDVDGSYIPGEGEEDPEGPTAALQYWYHADDMFTVAALTDSSGNVAERYHYDDYGTPKFLNASFALLSPAANGRIESVIGNPHGFTGREWDAESALWQYRYRYISPGLGRFLSRDPIGTWSDRGNQGSAIALVRSRPTALIDPFGLASFGSLPKGITKMPEWGDFVHYTKEQHGMGPKVHPSEKFWWQHMPDFLAEHGHKLTPENKQALKSSAEAAKPRLGTTEAGLAILGVLLWVNSAADAMGDPTSACKKYFEFIQEATKQKNCDAKNLDRLATRCRDEMLDRTGDAIPWNEIDNFNQQVLAACHNHNAPGNNQHIVPDKACP